MQMKQSLIAIAVSTALIAPAAAMADTTLYGDFRASVNSIDNSTDTLSMDNNASRIGLKGAYGNDNLKGIFHLQMYVINDNVGINQQVLGSRFYFAGLKGSFGSVIVGNTSTAYKMAGVKLDPFYDTSVGTGHAGSNYGLSGLTNGFTNNTLAYTSPKLGGAFTVNAAAYLNDMEDQDYNIGGQYSKDGITAGIQYISTNDVDAEIALARTDSTATRLYAGYKASNWSVGGSYEMIDAASDTSDDTYIHVAGTYNITPATKIAAAWGKVDDAAGAKAWDQTGDGYSIGVFHNILPKTTLSAYYGSVDFDDASDSSDRKVFGIGIKQAFSK